MRRLRREPHDRAPRDRRAAATADAVSTDPRARHLRQAAAARRGDLRARRLPRPAGRPARRGQSAGGARRAGGHARRRPTSPSPRATRIISIRRLLARGEEPLIYHRESLVYDPTTPTVESELGVTALRDLFEGGVGAGPKHGELIIHASVLTEDEARHVDRPPGSAAWVLEHLFYDYDDAPMSWGRFVCRGDLLQFHARIGVQAPAPETKPRSRRRS